MDKKQFFSIGSVRSYLDDLNKNLQSLPLEERNKYLAEIKADIHASALDIEENNKIESEEVLAKETLQSFMSPENLADEILNEHKNDFADNHKANKSTAQLFTGFSVGGLGALSVPILIGFINISATLPFLIAILIGTVTIIVNKKVLWNQQMVSYFKKTIRYSTFGYLALGFGFFAIRLIISGELDNFVIYYTLFYLAIGALYILALNKVYQRKAVQLQ